MNTLDSLLARALVVMNETRKKLNTATRVGSLFRDILTFISNLVLGIILKGSRANFAAIQSIATKAKGDTYRAEDTNHFWTWDGTQWNDIGEIIPANVATREELEIIEQKLSNNLTTYDQYDLSQYIKELYITGVTDSDVIASRSFNISPTSGRLILYVNGDSALDFNITSGMEANKVFEPTQKFNNFKGDGYIVFNPGTAAQSSTTTMFLIFDNRKVMNLAFAPISTIFINNKQQTQINTNTTNIGTNTTGIAQVKADIKKGDFVISDSSAGVENVNKILAELFIGNADLNSEYKFTQFALDLTNNQWRFFLQENGVNITQLQYAQLDAIWWNKPIPIVFTDNKGKYGYFVFNHVSTGYNISSANLIISNEKMLDLAFSPIILESITRQHTIDIGELKAGGGSSTEIAQLRKDLTTGNVIISAGTTAVNVNSIVAELFIGNAKPNSEYKFTQVAISLTNNQWRIFIQENGVNITQLQYEQLDAIWWGKPIPLTFTDNAGKYGYIVFNQITSDFSISAANLILSNVKIMDLSFSPVILKYITRTNTLNIAALMNHGEEAIPFTSNSSWNLRIKEMYLPNMQSNWRMRRLYVRANNSSLFISTTESSTSSSIVQMAINNTDTDIFDKVLTLYATDTPEIVGYCILEYYNNEDFVQDSSTGATFTENVKDLSKSPRIKKILESDEQIVLIGASGFGFRDASNVLREFLMAESGKLVYNCGFGGCRMSWRTPGGTNNYDKFSGIEVADAINIGNFSNMLAANTALDGYFDKRLAEFMVIDWTKPTTVFCKYIDNDITGDTPIGNLWEYTDLASNFDKTTFLGAMNYVFQVIFEKYPHLRWIFFKSMWRYGNSPLGNVPRYLYKNSLNLSPMDYDNAMTENAERLGASTFDFANSGIRNNFNFNYLSMDGSHLNYIGWKLFAKQLFRLYNRELL